MSKLKNTVKVIGLLTVLGAAAAKLAPLLKDADPKLKKKFGVVIKHLAELKDDVTELGAMAAKELKKKK